MKTFIHSFLKNNYSECFRKFLKKLQLRSRRFVQLLANSLKFVKNEFQHGCISLQRDIVFNFYSTLKIPNYKFVKQTNSFKILIIFHL